MNQTGEEDRETGEVTFQEDKETGEVTRSITGPGGEAACPHGEEPECPNGVEPACPHGEEPECPNGVEPACPHGQNGSALPPGEEPANPPGEEPVRPPGEEPACPPGEEPACPPEEEPACPPEEEPARPPGEEPARPPGEEPACPPGEEPACPPGEEPVHPPGEEPAGPPEEEPVGPPGEEPAGPPGEEPACPPGEEPVRPPGEEPARPPGEEPVRPPGEEPACPPGEEPACPPGEEPACLPGEEPACPPGEEPVRPPVEEAVRPRGEEPACPPGEEPACPPGEDPVHPLEEASINQRVEEEPDKPQAEVELESLLNEESGEDTGNAIEAAYASVQEQGPQSEGPCGWGSWLRQREIPAHYRTEMSKLIRLAAPLLVCEFLNFMIIISSIKVAGDRSHTEHSIVALAVAVFNILVISVGNGLAQTFDTFISQTSGSGNLRRVGVLLQRGIAILLLSSFPLLAVLTYTEAFLLRLTHNKTVASVSQTYIYIQYVTVPTYFMYQLQVKYLQNQGYLLPQVVTAVAGSFMHLILIYFFLDVMLASISGLAMATLVTYCTMPLLLCLLMVGKGIQKAKWSGWGEDSFQEWGSFAKTALLSVTAQCMQCWVFEIWVFLDGYHDWLELGTRSMVYSLYMAAFTIPQAFSGAASVCVGNALGAGNIMEAKLASRVSVICGVAVGLFIGAFMALLKDYSGYLIFENPEMVKKAASVVLLFSLLYALDTAVSVTGGVLRGAGKLLLCAVTAVVRLAFGLFIGRILMTNKHMGLMGLGIGIIAGVAFQLIIFSISLYRLDWQQAVKEARKRAGVLVSGGMEMKNQGASAEAAPADPPLRVRYVTVMGEALSTRQLYLRRGTLTVAMLLLVFAAGVGRGSVMSLLI